MGEAEFEKGEKNEMNLKGKNILVTGAGGFIGSHLVERLIDMGANVRAFIKYNSMNNEGALRFIPAYRRKVLEIFKGDVRDLESVQKAVKGINVVFHLAALGNVPYSIQFPNQYIETNVVGSANMLLASSQEGVEKYVQTSSSEVYGSALYIPIDEDHKLQSQSPYAASKTGADHLAMSYYFALNFPVSIIRPFNCYGPRQSDRAFLITLIAQAIKKNTIKLGSLSPVRDLTYVADTVDGFIKIAESSHVGNIFNIGYGEGYSIGQFVGKVADILGKDIEVVEDSSRLRPVKSEVKSLVADNSKARDLLDWTPKHDLTEGLEHTIDWVRDHVDLFDTEKYAM